MENISRGSPNTRREAVDSFPSDSSSRYCSMFQWILSRLCNNRYPLDGVYISYRRRRRNERRSKRRRRRRRWRRRRRRRRTMRRWMRRKRRRREVGGGIFKAQKITYAFWMCWTEWFWCCPLHWCVSDRVAHSAEREKKNNLCIGTSTYSYSYNNSRFTFYTLDSSICDLQTSSIQLTKPQKLKKRGEGANNAPRPTLELFMADYKWLKCKTNAWNWESMNREHANDVTMFNHALHRHLWR